MSELSPEHTQIPLQSGRGRLNPAAVGWSRHPQHDCRLKGNWLRRKRWNYWAFTCDDLLFSVTVADLDYAGLAFVYLADTGSGRLVEKTVTTALGRGCSLSSAVSGNAAFHHRALNILMTSEPGEKSGKQVQFAIDIPDFGGQPLTGRLSVDYPPGHETLNVVVPWSERHYQFTAKHNTLPAEGNIRVGQTEYRFEGPESFACLDLGRGVWPYRSCWNWGAASGRQAGHVVGLNLGGQWTDGTGATENALCIDGRLSKIDDTLCWHYSPSDYHKPWRITGGGEQGTAGVDLVFTPCMERVASSNLLIVRSEVHQMLGHYSGEIRDDKGNYHPIDGLFGWAEDHSAAW